MVELSERDRLLIEKATAFSQEYMSGPKFDGSHDYGHVQRVLRHAQRIYQAEVAARRKRVPDETTVVLAALLHDVDDHKYASGRAANGDGLPPTEDSIIRLLTSWGADPTVADSVQVICKHVSYSFERRQPEAVAACLEQHPELAIVQDADRLDAIGAVGVARTFTFSGARGRPMDDSIAHFHDKLEKIEAGMKTDAGREMAREYGKRLVQFRKWFEEEAEGR